MQWFYELSTFEGENFIKFAFIFSFQDAERYRQIFEHALSEFERLEKELIARYDALDLASFKKQSIEIIPVMTPSKVHPVDRDGKHGFLAIYL